MSKSEKSIEISLSNILNTKNFNEEFIYFSPNENEDLKNLFKNCSKTKKKNNGIPDRIFYDKKTLIIFECKNNSKKCISDIFHYLENLNNVSSYNNLENIFGVAYISDSCYFIYKFIDSEIIPIENKCISLETFNLEKDNNIISITNLHKYIHEIHNYIRDNTKISNEDKSFFMAIILISLNKKTFRDIIKNYDEKKYIFDYLKDNLGDFDIDINVFEFFKKDKVANKHFYNIITKILKIYEYNISEDLLNLFYSEFIKYSNTDSKSLGIVLTPSYIVELMNFLLNINSNDIVLDLCSGTGSFLLESLKYNPKKIIGCEIQKKLFTLLKCNFILRNTVKLPNYEIFNEDCFDMKFTATKSIINPPFSMKDKDELDFVLKQIDSVKNGLVCAIIPISCLSSNKNNYNKKKLLLDSSTLKCLINLNSKIFYPTANIECCIVLFDTTKPHSIENDKVLFIDYTDDSTEIIRNTGKIKKSDFEDKYNQVVDIINKNCDSDVSVISVIEISSEWHYNNFSKNVIKNDYTIDLKKLALNKLEFDFSCLKFQVLNKEYKYNNSNIAFGKFKISDIFNIESIKIHMSTYVAKNNLGNIEYISATKNNNGVTSYTKFNENYELSKPYCLSIVTAGDGGSGFCFFRKYQFYASSSILKLHFNEKYSKYSKSDNINLYFASEISKLHDYYSYGRKLSKEKLMNEYIVLPIESSNIISFEKIEEIYNFI